MYTTDGKIDPLSLLHTFMEHTAQCRSAHIVLDHVAAFESWFQVELAHVLSGVPNAKVGTSYTYADGKRRADLVVTTGAGEIVFELKCFVAKQDSNKKEKFPEQLALLRDTVSSGNALQGIALVTFIGYSIAVTEKQFHTMLPPGEWQCTKLASFSGHSLWIGIAST